jgi:hypothetical protein
MDSLEESQNEMKNDIRKEHQKVGEQTEWNHIKGWLRNK